MAFLALCRVLLPHQRVICRWKGGNRMNPKTIGLFLKQLRNEKKLTQEQLAEVLGVSGRTVSRWETGNNLPDLSILVQIWNIMGLKSKRS
jgi:DNA-binding XRE family transcriptional regulator